jgi:hypothetical protein
MSPSYSFINNVCQLLIDLETTNVMYTQEKVFKIVVVSIFVLFVTLQSTLINTLISAFSELSLHTSFPLTETTIYFLRFLSVTTSSSSWSCDLRFDSQSG